MVTPLFQLTTAALMTALTVISGYIILPIGPVPITMQTCIVLISGAVLGGRWGALSQLVYLGMGLMGLPVFAGGRGGPAIVLSPTFGYIIGFIFAALITGRYLERYSDRSVRRITTAMLLGQVAIWSCGLLYLTLYFNIIIDKSTSWYSILTIGWLPFLPFDAVKIALAVTVTLSVYRYFRPPNSEPNQ